ncbi:hypothetical protein VTI28DRAFT_6400 [Corynascus sepedonium]
MVGTDPLRTRLGTAGKRRARDSRLSDRTPELISGASSAFLQRQPPPLPPVPISRASLVSTQHYKRLEKKNRKQEKKEKKKKEQKKGTDNRLFNDRSHILALIFFPTESDLSQARKRRPMPPWSLGTVFGRCLSRWDRSSALMRPRGCASAFDSLCARRKHTLSSPPRSTREPEKQLHRPLAWQQCDAQNGQTQGQVAGRCPCRTADATARWTTAPVWCSAGFRPP